MVRRRGRPRRSYAWLRRKKYFLKYAHEVIPLRFKLLLPPMSASIKTELSRLDYLEVQVFEYLEAQAVPEIEWPNYMAFAKRCYKSFMTYWYDTALTDTDLIINEFVLRGLTLNILQGIRDIVIEKAGTYRGLPPLPERHPTYVCWFNRCENCNEWTINSHHTCEVITTDKKENTGAIKLTCPTQNLEADEGWIDRLMLPNDCEYYKGFWVKAPLGHDGSIADIGFYESEVWPYDFALVRFNYSIAQGYRYALISRQNNTTLGPAVWFNYNPDEWYWIEIRNWNGTVTLRVNGVIRASNVHGGTHNPYTRFLVTQPYGYWFGTLYLDYIRIADRYEYPPE